MPDRKKRQVFISYRREDVQFAEILRQKLLEWDFDVWMDIYNIPQGAYWPDEIDRGLRASDIVVGVMSPDSIESRNVKNEWDWSIVNDKPLILLMLRDTQIPMNYISINYVNFTENHDYAFNRLKTGLTQAKTGAYTNPVEAKLKAQEQARLSGGFTPEDFGNTPPPNQPLVQRPPVSSAVNAQVGPVQIGSQVSSNAGLGLAALLMLGGGAVIFCVAAILLAVVLSGGGDDNGDGPTADAASNVENFYRLIFDTSDASNLEASRQYVCPALRDSVPDVTWATIQAVEAELGQPITLTSLNCIALGDAAVECISTSSFTNETVTETFAVDDNGLYCQAIDGGAYGN